MKISKPVLFVFIFALLFSLYLFLSGPEKKVKKEPETPSVPLSPPSLEIEKKVETGINMGWSKDPFLLPFEIKKKEKERVEEPKPEIRLLAIIEGRKGRMAILGDEVVLKGDIIKSGEEVIEIGKDSVTLLQGKERRTLFLEEKK